MDRDKYKGIIYNIPHAQNSEQYSIRLTFLNYIR